MRERWRARCRVGVSTALAVAAAAAALDPPAASAAATCEFSASSGTLTLGGSGDLELRRMGAEIAVAEHNSQGWAPRVACANAEAPGGPVTPTVTETATIDVSTVGTLVIRLDGGPFEPGAGAEAAAPEIEFSIAPGVVRSLWVQGGGEAEEFELGEVGGTAGINLNAAAESDAQSDSDIAFPRVSDQLLKVSGGDGNDLITAAGGGHFAAALSTPVDLSGDFGNDLVVAGSGPANAHGGPGDDRVEGGPAGDSVVDCEGADQLTAGPGDDLVIGGNNRAVYDGGGGDDVLWFGCWFVRADPGDVINLPGIRVDMGTTARQEIGGGAVATLLGIENLIGTDSRDVLLGDGGANVIHGEFGDDRIRGFGGDDSLLGGEGADRLDGGEDADRLLGEHGRDRLFARDGTRDRLLDCGGGPPKRQRALRDPVDPPARRC